MMINPSKDQGNCIKFNSGVRGKKNLGLEWDKDS